MPGFTRGEVAWILLGETALLTPAALPFVRGSGRILVRPMASAFATELCRSPLAVPLTALMGGPGGSSGSRPTRSVRARACGG